MLLLNLRGRKMTKKHKLIILLNLIAVLAQVYASTICIINRGWLAFQYYTMDSNIFSAITSILLIYSLLTKGSVSERIHNFRYYSTCCVTVTFIVVVTILVPIAGWHTLPDRLFRGTDLWLQTVGPLLNIFCFVINNQLKIHFEFIVLQSFFDSNEKFIGSFGNIHKNEFLSNQVLGLEGMLLAYRYFVRNAKSKKQKAATIKSLPKDFISLQLDWHSIKTLASLLCVTDFRRFC